LHKENTTQKVVRQLNGLAYHLAKWYASCQMAYRLRRHCRRITALQTRLSLSYLPLKRVTLTLNLVTLRGCSHYAQIRAGISTFYFLFLHCP